MVAGGAPGPLCAHAHPDDESMFTRLGATSAGTAAPREDDLFAAVLPAR